MAETHDHPHGHAHSWGVGSRRSLTKALAVTGGFLVVEATAGWLTNSLALLSDAGHMLTDTASLALSLLALRIGELPPSTTKTYGYRRMEILAALANGLALWAIVALITREALERVVAPPAVDARGILAVAGLGLVANLFSLRLLHRHKDDNLNIRGAFLHVLADSLGSVGALGAGAVVYFTGWALADPLVSLAICALILWSSWGLVRESVHVLLEGVPAHIDFREVEAALLGLEGVCCVYDLHIWSIAGGREAVSAHVVVVDGLPNRRELLRTAVETLRQRFGIDHATLQVEESHELREYFEQGGDASCRVTNAGCRSREPAQAP